ncbi:hypothetical protein Afil01_26680 [Actinorhabdospora filicis]|uniref:OmpR/PhoB-type domain-containing protein n=1 Tax=Actinorhabdospora filicis TaxID=1785913 RepID=A0A9W6SNJ6_9ACTN|nr:BTAD domain-containing putative transcriptional regulator [Actinorhabdospora filicis]GLZ77861.1 hypothetical protein Afil01_26680 [Actinorhabdospora filicis]
MPTADDLRLGVLGPLTVEDAAGPVDVKGPRHREVLARLLVAEGRVVPVGVLIGDLWPEPPAGATGALQTFIAALRRALEPGRPPRAPATVLVTEAPGYALRVPDAAVDARRFEAAVAESGRLLTAGRAREAHDLLDTALSWWRGPAYAEFAGEPWAFAAAARLEDLRLLAAERRAEAALSLGRAAETAADLAAHVAAHPRRGDAWRLLALALYRAGRQGDALAALRRARAVLDDEGLLPDPALRDLERDVLRHAPLLRPPGRARLTGRDAELARLRAAADRAAATGRLVPALLSGEPGAGKTALAEELAESWPGGPVVWSRGTWPEFVDALPGFTPPEPGPGDPAAVRARLHRAVTGHLAGLAPVLLAVDDLDRADPAVLDYVTALLTAPPAAPVLLLAAHRDTAPSAALTAALSRAARLDPVRVHLAPLEPAATAALIAETTGTAVAPDVAAAIHARSGGNPFYARELARLLAEEGPAALTAVPAGVRDVVRHRLARLPAPAHAVLATASVLGVDVPLDVLTRMAGDAEVVLDAVDAALAHGFATADAHRMRFGHALVRDTLYADIAAPRRARRHALAAEAVDDDDARSHHYFAAGDFPRAAATARAAALAAGHRFHDAARLWSRAHAAQRHFDAGPRERVEVTMGLVAALAVTGDLAAARRHRAEAIATARALGDRDVLAATVTSYDVPAIWPVNDDEELSALVVAAAEEALPDAPVAVRARLLATIAMETRGARDGRGRRAAAEAEDLARAIGDPALLAFTLNARFMHAFHRAGLSGERAAIAAEIIALAQAHDLVSFAVLGHLIAIQSAAATGDHATGDAHASAVTALAERYEVPLVAVFTDWYAALKNPTEAAYRRAAARLDTAGMPGVAGGLLPLALLSLRLRPGAVPAMGDLPPMGPYEPWARPLRLLPDRAAAARALAATPASPRDLLLEARACLTAAAAIALGDRDAMGRAHGLLLPAEGELAGAGSGMVSFGPVPDWLAATAPPT